MNQNLPPLLALSLVALMVSVLSGDMTRFARETRQFAATFFVESVTPESARAQYANSVPIHVLIVPGHDEGSPGAAFSGLRESGLTLSLSKDLLSFFQGNPKFKATLLRDDAGYNQEFERYVAENRSVIGQYVVSQKEIAQKLIDAGRLSFILSHTSNVYGDVPFRLYAANAWANAKGVDLIIHVHFNDHPRRITRVPGKYTGTAIYVPDHQYSNARASRELGESIAIELSRYYPMSDYPNEEGGVVEDFELIAIGANNTLDGMSVLAEYSYIYEPYFQERETRKAHMREMAFQTYRGVLRFFDRNALLRERSTLFLPHSWAISLEPGDKKSLDVLALQAALRQTGDYPPPGNDLRDCPLSGAFRTCTTSAVKNFQKNNGLDVTGIVGPMTKAKLNDLYSR